MTPLRLDALADTSFVVGLSLASDTKHPDCLKVYQQFRHIGLAEAAYAGVAFMLTREGGVQATGRFFGGLFTSKYRPISLEAEDYPRIHDLLTTYADAELDFADVVIVAIAERLGITRIFTLDQRDFRMIRPRHTDHFELLP